MQLVPLHKGGVGGGKNKQPLWHDLWANTLDVGVHEKGFVTREVGAVTSVERIVCKLFCV
jgi:hypothetical protein